MCIFGTILFLFAINFNHVWMQREALLGTFHTGVGPELA